MLHFLCERLELSTVKKKEHYLFLIGCCQESVKFLSLFPSIPDCKCLPLIYDLFLNVLHSDFPNSVSEKILMSLHLRFILICSFFYELADLFAYMQFHYKQSINLLMIHAYFIFKLDHNLLSQLISYWLVILKSN